MSDQPSTLQTLFAELKRRRVFRVIAMYGVVSFIVLQIADLVFPILELPDWTLQFVLMLTLLGFPFAIVIAWAFQATDEGIRRAEPASPELIQEILALPAVKRWPAGLLALLGMGLLFWSGWWMGNRSLGDGANIIVPSAEASDFKAIAALPFENVNGDDENRLIAVGVHEDLLSQLQRISAFRVTGRTSVREYADTDKTFDQIARELGVEYLLDGSVRSSGSQIVVTAALMDAASGEQLWTDRYDQAFTPENLFEIQSQIARQLVDALEAELTPDDMESLQAMSPGSDLAAQIRYHRAVELYERSTDNGVEARDELLAALEIDPNFVAAWSRLAHMLSWLVWRGEQVGAAEAREAVERTVELAPGTVEAHLARGFYEYYAERDYDAALSAFREAERLAPSNSEVIFAVSLILRRQGDYLGSTEMMKRAVRLDPRNSLKLMGLRENLVRLGAFEDADAVAERELAIAPGSPQARWAKARTLANLDGGMDLDRVRRFTSEMGFDPTEPLESAFLAYLVGLQGDYERAVEILEQRELEATPLGLFLDLWPRLYYLNELGDQARTRAVADSLLALVAEADLSDVNQSGSRILAYASLGRPEELRRELSRAEAVIRRWEDTWTGPFLVFTVVMGYGVLGDLDTGFDWLAEIVERPFTPAWEMRLDPWFEPYRDDPRFEEIVRRLEASEAEGAAWAAARRPWLP